MNLLFRRFPIALRGNYTSYNGNSYAVYRVADIAEDVWHTYNANDRFNTGANATNTSVNGAVWVQDCIKISGKSGADSVITDVPPTGDGVNVNDAYVVVSQSGRIKQSGTATIDGVRYTIKNYKVTNTDSID